MSTFNYSKYNGNSIGIQDASDAYANSDFVITFYHLMSKKTLKFKAYITNYNETYNSNFNAEEVFGRADPIYSFRNTTRQISLAFKMPASSTGEAYENLAKAQHLIQFLYPAYTDDQNTLTIAQTPLVRMKVMNLLANSKDRDSGDPSESAASLYDSYTANTDSEKGLLGVLSNLTVMHNIENGEIGVFEKSAGTILPKVIEISLNFNPIHEHTVGWKSAGDGGAEFYEKSFPYGATMSENTAAAPVATSVYSQTSNTANSDTPESPTTNANSTPVESPNQAAIDYINAVNSTLTSTLA